MSAFSRQRAIVGIVVIFSESPVVIAVDIAVDIVIAVAVAIAIADVRISENRVNYRRIDIVWNIVSETVIVKQIPEWRPHFIFVLYWTAAIAIAIAIAIDTVTAILVWCKILVLIARRRRR